MAETDYLALAVALTRGFREQALPVVASDADPERCPYCTTGESDAEWAPYCSAQCAVDASVDR